MAEVKHTPGNFTLVVKRASAGRGLFTQTKIPKGACVIEYTGRPITEQEKFKSRSKYLFDCDNGTTIDGAVKTNLARYINHSCRPNCEVIVEDGRVWVHAIKSIKPGEELNYNYGEDYFDAYIGEKCRCTKCVAKRAKAEADEPALQAAG